MKIAIIGSGNVGGALAQQWVKAGHTVLVGAKFPLSEKNINLATKIGEDRQIWFANSIFCSNNISRPNTPSQNTPIYCLNRLKPFPIYFPIGKENALTTHSRTQNAQSTADVAPYGTSGERNCLRTWI